MDPPIADVDLKQRMSRPPFDIELQDLALATLRSMIGSSPAARSVLVDRVIMIRSAPTGLLGSYLNPFSNAGKLLCFVSLETASAGHEHLSQQGGVFWILLIIGRIS
jgi:hypothetical protein